MYGPKYMWIINGNIRDRLSMHYDFMGCKTSEIIEASNLAITVGQLNYILKNETTITGEVRTHWSDLLKHVLQWAGRLLPWKKLELVESSDCWPKRGTMVNRNNVKNNRSTHEWLMIHAMFCCSLHSLQLTKSMKYSIASSHLDSPSCSKSSVIN